MTAQEAIMHFMHEIGLSTTPTVDRGALYIHYGEIRAFAVLRIREHGNVGAYLRCLNGSDDPNPVHMGTGKYFAYPECFQLADQRCFDRLREALTEHLFRIIDYVDWVFLHRRGPEHWFRMIID
jgi:hypothetical protein